MLQTLSFSSTNNTETPKNIIVFFVPYRFTGLRDCPTQCARLLHPASTRVLPVPHLAGAYWACLSACLPFADFAQESLERFFS